MSPNPSPTPAPGGPQLTASFADVLKAMQGLTATAQQATTPLEAIKKTFADIGATLMDMLDPTEKVRDAFTGFKDAIGSLGEAFRLAAPSFEFATKPLAAAAEYLGDRFEFISGLAQTTGTVLSTTFGILFGKMGDAVTKFGAKVPLLTNILGGIGGAVEAIAGAFGSVLGKAFEYTKAAVVAVAERLPAVVNIIGQTANVIIKSADAYRQLGGAIAGMLGQFADSAANMLRGPMRVLDVGIQQVNQNLTRFVALYDPYAVFKFQYAVDSLYAALGQAMAPALYGITEIVQSLTKAIAGTSDQGKTLISAIAAGTVGLTVFGAAMLAIQTIATGGIGPIIGAITGLVGGVMVATGALQPLFDSLSGTLSGLMDSLGGVLVTITALVKGSMLDILQKSFDYLAAKANYLGKALERMAPAIEAATIAVSSMLDIFMSIDEITFKILVESVVLLAKAAAMAVQPMILLAQSIDYIITTIKDMLGLVGLIEAAPEGPTKEGPAPVRGVSTTDASGALRQAYERAFQIGSGAEKPEVKIANHMDGIAKDIAAMKAFLNVVANEAQNLLNTIGTGASNGLNHSLNWLKDAVNGITNKFGLGAFAMGPGNGGVAGDGMAAINALDRIDA